MIHARTRAEVRAAIARMRAAGERIALVPTMGYLHEGHLALVDLARERAERVALSIFVNPLQFGPGEDLDRYPRALERDLEAAKARGVDLAFAPATEEMYPSGEPTVTVDPGPLADRLCGAYRPGHFRGVLTVVARLFSLFRPDVAVFGRKDFQQLVLVRRMAQDLDMGVDVLGAPIVREEDGLAMSSRNALLPEAERADAPAIHRALLALRERFRAGGRESASLLRGLGEELARSPRLRLQYAEIVHPETLDPLDRAEPGSVVAVAVHAGETRLIDNEVLE